MSLRRVWAALLLTAAALLAGCGGSAPALTEPAALNWENLEFDHSMELVYADQFTLDTYRQGYRIVTIGGTDRYLVVPEDAPVPAGVPEEVTVLQQPLDRIYLVATSAMDLFRELDALDRIRLSGTDASGWYIEEAKQAMERGDILYAGKYSAPDYERILAEGCDLALESTMIYHTPEVREQLLRLGIPVLVERSSYESHPLGRVEWIRLYGALLGREQEADAYFSALLDRLAPVLDQPGTGKTVAFFYITSNGAANVRKPGDYIAKSIALAGGEYILRQQPGEESASSTMNMQLEAFYEQARDADVLIYNSAIDAELHSLEELLDKSSLLKDFKAVREGNVWCTGKNLFQESLGLGDLIWDLHAIVTARDPESLELTYLHRLD